jgi:hypothetical protein
VLRDETVKTIQPTFDVHVGIHIHILCLSVKSCMYRTNLHSDEAFLALKTDSEIRHIV